MNKKVIILIILVVLFLITLIISPFIFFKEREEVKKPEKEREEFKILKQEEGEKTKEVSQEFPQELINLDFDKEAKIVSGYEGQYITTREKQRQIGILSSLPIEEVFNHYLETLKENNYTIILENQEENVKNIITRKENYLVNFLILKEDNKTRIEIQMRE